MNGEFDYEFGLLLDAMIYDREKVRDIVRGNPAVLEATNRTGENVLRWFALENGYQEVTFLRSLGSSIQSSALSEAVEMGHTRMVGLLLELGGEPELDYCRAALKRESDMLTSRQKHIIRSHFKDYGYEL